MPPPVQYSSLPPRRMYPDESYTATVYPTSHVSSTEYLDACGASMLCHPPLKNRVMPLPVGETPLLSGYYTAHFTTLLSMWLDAELQRMKQATIPLVPLTFVPTANNAYKLSIPGIREDAPKLAIGDRLALRWMIHMHQAPSAVAFEAEVTGLNKLAGWVYVKSPYLEYTMSQLQQTMIGEPRFQVRFMLSVDPFCAMQDAVRRIGFAADQGHIVARRWLVPEPHDVHEGSPSGRGMIREWCDPYLNAEQRVSNISCHRCALLTCLVCSRAHCAPYAYRAIPHQRSARREYIRLSAQQVGD